MAINFVNFIKRNTIHSVTDLTAIVYIPVRNTMIQLSIILILLCIIFIVRGWNKSTIFIFQPNEYEIFYFKDCL